MRGEGPRLFRKGRILEFLEDRTEVHAGRIDRIVRARIRDVPGLVQILRDLHRLSRAKADAVGLGDEHRRIERRGRTLFSLVLNVLADESLRRTLGQLEGGLRLRVRPKRPVLVIRFELRRGALRILAEPRMEGPIILRDEILDLPLPIHDEGEGRALDPADRKVVPAELFRCDG